ncbi:MAG: hypothetical protein ACRD2P_12255 [Terriglobia bacterium]
MRLIVIITVLLFALTLRGGAQATSPSFYTGHIMVGPNQTSATLTFPVPYSNGEDCAGAPYSDLSGARWWLNIELGSVTVNVSKPPQEAEYFGVICNGS